ncbi:MAG: transglutaminase domain-containing protein [Bacteroidota bacterium]
MKLIYAFLLLFLVCFKTADAQDFEYGKVIQGDLNLKNTVLDSNANAMVIREFGTSSIRLNDQIGAQHGRLYVYYKYHVKIKIFNKNGFGSGNIVIPRRIYDDGEDEIEEIKASTSNVLNGKLVVNELDKKNIFNEKRNKFTVLTKFTMPNLAEGSIVEYSYIIRIYSIFNFKEWEFQSSIPKLHSEYIANIPALYTYNTSLRGFLKLTSNKAVVNKECFRMRGQTYDCSELTYVMKNVPAFIEEDYMTAASNFRSAIYYELAEYYQDNGVKKQLTKTWKDVDYELMSEASFGGQMKKKDLFKELLPVILKGATDSMSKAEAVYNYISKTIKFDRVSGMYSENTVKKALEMHSGNTADINLALIAALNAAGLDADALILSTRNNGTVNSLYPVISDFNYVVAKVNIGEKSYLLDASVPYLPFGLLPPHCMNGKGRVINFKKPSYWYDIKASQKDFTMYALDAELTTDGKLKGIISTTSSGYAALFKRELIAAANSVEEYVEKLDESMPSIRILKHQVVNVDSLNESLKETYEIEMKIWDNTQYEKLFFNPFFIDRISKNPFNMNERIYPVDFGASKEIRLSVNIKLPENFSITESPKNMSLALADNGGRYIFKTGDEKNLLSFSQVFQQSKPTYTSDDYLALKEFYSRIIQLQKTDVVFKKTN